MSAPSSVAGRLRTSLPVLLPCLVYVVLSLAGVTQSNLGALHAGTGPVAHQLGTPQQIRSDEFMTETPIALGWMASGGHGATDPLSVPPNFFSQLPSGPISSVVFFDGSIARLAPWLPDAVLFAARWWLPTLLLALALPAWFREVTGSRRWGWVATALIFFAPANQWWSGRPVNTLGFMFAGAVLMMGSHRSWERGRRARALTQAALAGVLIARFPSYYQPFAIVLGFPVLVGTALFLVRQRSAVAARAIAIASTGLVAAALTAGTMLESLSAIRSGLGTVYPGHRVSTGGYQTIGIVFGATVLAPLKSLQDSVAGMNATETSSAFTVLVLAAILVRATCRWSGADGTRALWWVWLAFTALWLSWCLLAWGALGAHLPLLTLGPPHGAAADCGFLATILFCLTMAQVRRPGVPVAVAAGVATAAVSLLAGFSLRHHGTPLGVLGVVVSSAVAAAVVAAAVRWPGRAVPLVAISVAAALTTALVNPLVAGLGDLRTSAAARRMLTEGAQARADRTLWASNDLRFDALMFATGTPALSARQQIGPAEAAWRRLDPTAAHRQVWNRGGSYIRFRWNTSQTIRWLQPSGDQIVMAVSPCALARLEPRLTRVVSRVPLAQDCLVPDGAVEWAGARQMIYRVR